MATVGQQLLAPESGWRRYDSDTFLLKYVGVWGKNTSGSTANSYNKTLDATIGVGDYVEFLFYGTKIRMIGIVSSVNFTDITISVDGVDEVVSNYNATFKEIALLYEKSGLENKLHKVRFTNKGNTGSTATFWFDAIDIDSDGELIRHDYYENTHLDEPMRKYGVAWFGFDESSGNIYDKLGSSHVGTVTGTTRVDGWNGEGKAIHFNGSSYAVGNSSIIPIGEKTIRFKFKLNQTPTQVGVIFSESYYATGQYGTYCYAIANTNAISFNVHKNGTNIIGVTTNILDLNKWYDIVFSWDGTINSKSIKVYVNDSLVTVGESSSTETNKATSNLHIGSYSDKNYKLTNAQIDDLQFFTKALSPSDFTQKRLAIKTTDNKNLVLSTESNRVKEIPSTDETDLVNQGYTWREIDEAVDRAIDLTQTTTEYEKVSKSNVVLGNGKMFTIPLDDFKTLKVEGNY